VFIGKGRSTCSISSAIRRVGNPFYRRPFSAAIPKMSAFLADSPFVQRVQRIPPGFRKGTRKDFARCFRRLQKETRGTGTNTAPGPAKPAAATALVSGSGACQITPATALSVPPREPAAFQEEGTTRIRAEFISFWIGISGPRKRSHITRAKLGLTEKALARRRPSVFTGSLPRKDRRSHPPGSEAPSAPRDAIRQGNHGELGSTRPNQLHQVLRKARGPDPPPGSANVTSLIPIPDLPF